jgi:hypothetical protein
MRVPTSVKVLPLVLLAVIMTATGWVWAQEQPAPEPTVAPAAAPPQVATPPAATEAVVPILYAQALRVEMKGKTKYSGNVAMQLTVQGRTPKLISVDVIPKMTDSDIAKDLYKEFTLAAGADFKVDRSGNEVTIKKANKKSPNLSLKITSQSIVGVSFLIDVN